MKVNGKHYRTVWMKGTSVFMIDQTRLPFEFLIFEAKSYKESCYAIKAMITRGAGAIGATAGFAMVQAYLESHGDEEMLFQAKNEIEATRPTARNLFYAVDRVFNAGKKSIENALTTALQMADENIEEARQIGIYGNELIGDGFKIETHCNAGWLGFVDYGSALSPIFVANEKGKNIFVFVDETRPRSQGARLTAWELKNENIEHAIIPDNAGAYYMSKGKVDMMIVGADRIAANGDVANKIGTLEKAIVAEKYAVPFYVAAPLSTFDIHCPGGNNIPIEQRGKEEVLFQEGPSNNGTITKILVSNPGSDAFNPAFDVTPAELIKGIITEKGIIKPNRESINKLFS
ncbi:MAG: S-methyl-5-thioribose-1-phosphate isomerase [Bacteroidales bacterium]|nr:S-methyl-5-thioribose-1-phosphate isomerase [Bacteroidales bacterium]MCF8403524.1 S-methyl-5-thioribose-1-phosphate isomerase [Bacteroidales bacterium]